MIYTVYGLFEGEACIYVGCTSNPKQRLKYHTSKAGRFSGRKIEMRHLAKTTVGDAVHAETRWMDRMRRRGHALENTQAIGKPPHGYAVKVLETGQVFRSIAAIARDFGCSHTAINTALEKHNGRFCDGFTLNFA